MDQNKSPNTTLNFVLAVIALSVCVSSDVTAFDGSWRAPGTKERISVKMAVGSTSSVARRMTLQSYQLKNYAAFFTTYPAR